MSWLQRATAQNPRQGSNRKAAAAPSPGLIQDSSIQKTKFHNIGRFTCPRDDHLEGRNGVFISCRTCLTYRFHRRGPCITSRHNPGMLKKNRSLTAVRLVLLALAKDVAVLLERRPCESSLAPQVGGKESVCVGDGNEGGLQCVLKSLGGTSGRGVSILDTSQLQETLDSGRGNETGTAGGGDETDGDGTALAGLLGGERVRLTEVGTPVTSSDGHNAELGDDDGSADSGRDFLGGLDTETNVTLGVTNDNDGLETGTLTGTGLLLDGLDLFCAFSSVYRSECCSFLVCGQNAPS